MILRYIILFVLIALTNRSWALSCGPVNPSKTDYIFEAEVIDVKTALSNQFIPQDLNVFDAKNKATLKPLRVLKAKAPLPEEVTISYKTSQWGPSFRIGQTTWINTNETFSIGPCSLMPPIYEEPLQFSACYDALVRFAPILDNTDDRSNLDIILSTAIGCGSYDNARYIFENYKEQLQNFKPALGTLLKILTPSEHEDTQFTGGKIFDGQDKQVLLNRFLDLTKDMIEYSEYTGPIDLQIRVKYETILAPSMLQYAAYHGMVELIQPLLDAGADLHERSTNTGSHILHLAVLSKDLDTVKMFIDHEADIMTPDINGELPIHYAAPFPDIFSFLLKAGSPIDTPLTVAAPHNKYIKYQLRLPQFTAYHCQNDSYERLFAHPQFLAVSNQTCNETSLYVAVQQGATCQAIIKSILSHDMYSRQCLMASDWSSEILLSAVMMSAPQSLKDILAEDNFTPSQEILNKALEKASYRGNSEKVDILIQAGADVNYQDGFGTTPLHNAMSSKFDHDRRRAIYPDGPGDQKYLATAQLLIQQGAEVNHQDMSGRSALFYAAMDHNIEMIEMLLAAGARLDLKTVDHNESAYDAAKKRRPNRAERKEKTLMLLKP